MNYKMIGRFLGQITLLEAVFMLPALILAIAGGELASVQGFWLPQHWH